MEHPNFYEDLKEALKRLRGTIVLYDGEPYYVLAITNHNPDGIMRIYMDPIGIEAYAPKPDVDYYDAFSNELGIYLDTWLKENPSTRVVRKYMSSAKFNRFMPFPLGMCNYTDGSAYYLERIPNRSTPQGLTSSMLTETKMTTVPVPPNAYVPQVVGMFSPAFLDTIHGRYPDPEECLKNLKDPAVENLSVGFHRSFAFVRAPLDMLYLGYRGEIVGYLPDGDLMNLTLGRDFGYLREAVEDLQLFQNVA